MPKYQIGIKKKKKIIQRTASLLNVSNLSNSLSGEQRWEGQGKTRDEIKKTTENTEDSVERSAKTRGEERRRRWARFGPWKGGWVRDERRWWTRLHPSIQTLGPAPAGFIRKSFFSTSRPRFSASPSCPDQTFYSVLLVSLASPLVYTRSALLSRSLVKISFRRSPHQPSPLSFVTSSFSLLLGSGTKFWPERAWFWCATKKERTRDRERVAARSESLVLLLFALDIPFTRDEPARRQLISWPGSDFRFAGNGSPRHLRFFFFYFFVFFFFFFLPRGTKRDRFFIGSLITGNSNSQTVRCPGWFFYGALNDPRSLFLPSWNRWLESQARFSSVDPLILWRLFFWETVVRDDSYVSWNVEIS